MRCADVRGRAQCAWWHGHACVVLGTHAHSTRVREAKACRQGPCTRKVLTIAGAVTEGTSGTSGCIGLLVVTQCASTHVLGVVHCGGGGWGRLCNLKHTEHTEHVSRAVLFHVYVANGKTKATHTVPRGTRSEHVSRETARRSAHRCGHSTCTRNSTPGDRECPAPRVRPASCTRAQGACCQSKTRAMRAGKTCRQDVQDVRRGLRCQPCACCCARARPGTAARLSGLARAAATVEVVQCNGGEQVGELNAVD